MSARCLCGHSGFWLFVIFWQHLLVTYYCFRFVKLYVYFLLDQRYLVALFHLPIICGNTKMTGKLKPGHFLVDVVKVMYWIWKCDVSQIKSLKKGTQSSIKFIIHLKEKSGLIYCLTWVADCTVTSKTIMCLILHVHFHG